MRLIFAGTPRFAVPVLEEVAKRHSVVTVLTQPDRPRGRSLRVEAPPVKTAAVKLGLPVLQPEQASDPSLASRLRSLSPEAVIVAAYGRMLPSEILTLAPAGCINVHPSLLPAYRGAAPIQRAMMDGCETTGVSIMKLDEGMDTGPVFAQVSVEIGRDETAGELSDRLAAVGAKLLHEVLEGIQAGTAEAKPQRQDGASVAGKIEKTESVINWRVSARRVHDLVRALNPTPGAFTVVGGRRVKVWKTAIVEETGPVRPGEIVTAGPKLVIGTADGAVRLLEVQPENKPRMTGEAFVRGYRPSVGDKAGGPE